MTDDSDEANVPERLPVFKQTVPEQTSNKLAKPKPKQKVQKPMLRVDWVCGECIEDDKDDTKKAIELLCNKEGSGGWVLSLEPRHG